MMRGTFLHSHWTNKYMGATGSWAKFSATTNARNEAAAAQNIPIMIEEFHGYACPPRFNAITRNVRVAISVIIPIRSSLARVARKFEP